MDRRDSVPSGTDDASGTDTRLSRRTLVRAGVGAAGAAAALRFSAPAVIGQAKVSLT